MAYIPEDAEWFLADLVEEIRVQGYKRNIVHINYVLVRAKTPEEAYREAMKLGKRANQRYENPEGRMVTHRFLGLHNLDAIFEPLEHGCEIMFVERLGLSSAGTRKLVRSKRRLEAFLPIRGRKGRPDYASKEIVQMVGKEMMRRKRAEPDASPNSGPAPAQKPRKPVAGRHR